MMAVGFFGYMATLFVFTEWKGLQELGWFLVCLGYFVAFALATMMAYVSVNGESQHQQRVGLNSKMSHTTSKYETDKQSGWTWLDVESWVMMVIGFSFFAEFIARHENHAPTLSAKQMEQQLMEQQLTEQQLMEQPLTEQQLMGQQLMKQQLTERQLMEQQLWNMWLLPYMGFVMATVGLRLATQENSSQCKSIPDVWHRNGQADLWGLCVHGGAVLLNIHRGSILDPDCQCRRISFCFRLHTSIYHGPRERSSAS